MNNNSKRRFKQTTKAERQESAALGYPIAEKQKTKHAKVAYKGSK